MVKLLGFLILVGLLVKYWWLVLAVVAVFAAVRAVPVAWREYQTERAQRAEVAAGLAERATIQDQWYLAGDERGVFGEYAA